MTTLVATVGLSPAAVAHAVRTLPHSRLVLVHTTGSAGEAERVREFARTVVDGPVDLVGIGDGVEFAETFSALTAALRGDRMIDPVEDVYQLDYTGGPKVLTTCAVARHHADHGDRGASLRSWVDDTQGLLRFGGDRPAIPVTGVDLVAMAGLHGFTLHGHLVEGARLELDAAAILTAVGGDDPQWIGRWRAAILRRCAPRSVGETTRTAWSDAANAVGTAFEMAVAATALSVDGIDEIGLHLDPRDGTPGQLTDLDVVVRRGARVVVIEAKRRASDLLPDDPGNRDGRQAGDQLALARLVFGSAARTLLVTGPGARADGPSASSAAQDVEASVARLGPAVPFPPTDRRTGPSRSSAHAPSNLSVAHVAMRDRHGVAATADAIDALLPPIRTDRRAPRPPRIERAPTETLPPPAGGEGQRRVYGELVVPVSGTVLGVAAAIRAVEARTTRLLGDAELSRALEQRLDPAVTELLGPPVVPEVGTEVAIPYARIPMSGTGAVAVGPGPKRVTAALVVQALDHDLDLVHVGLDGTVRSWRHGRWPADGRVGWTEHLADTMRPVDAGDVPAPVRGFAERARPHAELLVPARAEHVWLPDLLVGFAAGCHAYVAPVDGRPGRARVRAVAAHLARLVGDAATLRVVLPADVADLDAWRRTAALRGWRVELPRRAAIRP